MLFRALSSSSYKRNKLSAIFANNKIDIIKPITKSGVYKLQCDDCDASFYIGQTGRSFNQRHVEHIYEMPTQASGE